MTEARRVETQQALRAAVVVGVIRDGDGARAERIARGLLEAGLQAVEITATTPDAFEILARLATDYPQAVLGIGTARTVAHLEAAEAAKAGFVVSPHTDPHLIRAGRSLGLVVIPGALTPTEIVTATEAGADLVKVFPVAAVGGAAYLRYLRGPLPDPDYWVSGQVALAEIGDYLAAGATLIGLTSALTADLDQDLEADLRRRVDTATRAVDDHREGAALLTIAVHDRTVELGMKALRHLPDAEHTRLDALVPGRHGHAVRLRVLLKSAGIPADATVQLTSHDGFARAVPAQALYEGGVLHYATDGHPLGRDQGGPLRLYIAQGTDQCDNMKGLSRISWPSG